jgi:hypothetical protein
MRHTLIDHSGGARLVYAYWRNDKDEVWRGGHVPISRRRILGAYESGLKTGHLRWGFYKLEPVQEVAAAAPGRAAPIAPRRWRTVAGANLKATGHAFELLAVLIKIQPATLDELLARAAEDGQLKTRGSSRRSIVRWYLNDLRKKGLIYVVDEQRSLPGGEERDEK